MTLSGGFQILGIYVGSGGGERGMYESSSCVDTHGLPYTAAMGAACPWLITASDFDTLKVQANALAGTLAGTATRQTTSQQEVTTVATTTTVEETSTVCTTENGACWLWLLLFIPLLVYLLWRPCSILRARRKARFTEPPPVVEAPVVAEPPAAAAPAVVEEEEDGEDAVAEAPPPEPEPPEAVEEPAKKSKFKWQVASAENYIWCFQGGARPMFVDKGVHEKSKWHTAHARERMVVVPHFNLTRSNMLWASS
jgi:hypothetical protein